MITIPNDPQVLRDKIRQDLDVLDMDELKQMYRMIAQTAAKKAILFADIDWEEKGLSREQVKKEISNYRKSSGK